MFTVSIRNTITATILTMASVASAGGGTKTTVIPPGGVIKQMSNGYQVSTRGSTLSGIGSPTRTSFDNYFTMEAIRSMMEGISVLSAGIFTVKDAYAQCRATYPDGQMKVVSGPTVVINLTTFERQFTAYGTYSCVPGTYIGWVASNQLGASEISFAAVRSVGATVCLTEAAVASTVVQLASYSTAVATVPASVTIPAGQRCANYNVSIVGVADTYIHAKLNGFWVSSFLRVNM